MGGEVLGGLDGGAGGGKEQFEGVDEVLGVAVLEFVAVGVVVAEGGDVVAGEGLGHLFHEGGAHGGAGAVAEDEEGDGVVGLEEEGGDLGAGGGGREWWFGGGSWRRLGGEEGERCEGRGARTGRGEGRGEHSEKEDRGRSGFGVEVSWEWLGEWGGRLRWDRSGRWVSHSRGSGEAR